MSRNGKRRGPVEFAGDQARKLAARPAVVRSLKVTLRRLGYDLKRVDKKWGWATPWLPQVMRKRGIAPATVVDVGAGRGTPELNRAFPDAYLVLIEPLTEFEAELKEIVSKRPGEYVLAAAGAAAGSGTIRVDPEFPLASSMPRVGGWMQKGKRKFEEREVPIVSLDGLLAERSWQPPFGLKIDVEGFEDQVIEGATEFLKRTQFVIAEVWTYNRFEGNLGFAEFVTLMYSLGFELCDILDAPRPKPDREIIFMDAMFWRRPAELAGRLP